MILIRLLKQSVLVLFLSTTHQSAEVEHVANIRAQTVPCSIAPLNIIKIRFHMQADIQEPD